MKNLINKIYAKSQKNLCAVIYGRLPPENRKYQTLKFNSDDSGFEYLVATNAVINNIFLYGLLETWSLADLIFFLFVFSQLKNLIIIDWYGGQLKDKAFDFYGFIQNDLRWGD